MISGFPAVPQSLPHKAVTVSPECYYYISFVQFTHRFAIALISLSMDIAVIFVATPSFPNWYVQLRDKLLFGPTKAARGGETSSQKRRPRGGSCWWIVARWRQWSSHRDRLVAFGVILLQPGIFLHSSSTYNTMRWHSRERRSTPGWD